MGDWIQLPTKKPCKSWIVWILNELFNNKEIIWLAGDVSITDKEKTTLTAHETEKKKNQIKVNEKSKIFSTATF